jgi:two-component system phosphate regulon response regulator PhoB
LKKVPSISPDILLLDIMLPGIDGLEVARRLKADRSTKHIPIVMLTAKGEESDIVKGLELGAEDYITKPFSPKVVNARLRAVLRRVANGKEIKPEDAVISFKDLNIHPGRHEVLVNSKPVKLTFTEFSILMFLARRPGWVLTRAQLIDAVRDIECELTVRSNVIVSKPRNNHDVPECRAERMKQNGAALPCLLAEVVRGGQQAVRNNRTVVQDTPQVRKKLRCEVPVQLSGHRVRQVDQHDIIAFQRLSDVSPRVCRNYPHPGIVEGRGVLPPKLDQPRIDLDIVHTFNTILQNLGRCARDSSGDQEDFSGSRVLYHRIMDGFLGGLASGDQSGLVSYSTAATLNKMLSNNHAATQTDQTTRKVRAPCDWSPPISLGLAA